MQTKIEKLESQELGRVRFIDYLVELFSHSLLKV